MHLFAVYPIHVLNNVVLNVIMFITRVVKMSYSNLFTKTSDNIQQNAVIFRENECAMEGFYVNKVFSLSLVLLSSVDSVGIVIKMLRYKSEGHWFDSKWCNWNFSLT